MGIAENDLRQNVHWFKFREDIDPKCVMGLCFFQSTVEEGADPGSGAAGVVRETAVSHSQNIAH